MDISLIIAWSIMAAAYVFIVHPALFATPSKGYWNSVLNGVGRALLLTGFALTLYGISWASSVIINAA